MATKSQRYDHPAYTVPRFVPVPARATAASTPVANIPFTYPVTIKKISGAVVVAGTNASAGYDIYNGTTSVGEIVAGTEAAGSVMTDLVQDISIAAGSILGIRTKANSAVLDSTLLIEFVPTPGSNITA